MSMIVSQEFSLGTVTNTYFTINYSTIYYKMNDNCNYRSIIIEFTYLLYARCITYCIVVFLASCVVLDLL
ncbi:MAG: hypothetical protein K0S93_1883 [Nitrososphaeraceae archaeon]|nr:hypothetical protein [Nitrososphaeraceae archaeon]